MVDGINPPNRVIVSADYAPNGGELIFETQDGNKIVLKSDYVVGSYWSNDDVTVCLALTVLQQHKDINQLKEEIENLKEHIHGQ